MPDTLFALAVLIILVMPGVVFVVQLENRLPSRNDLSSLRELVLIVGAGAICDSLVLFVFGIIRALFPQNTPDVGSIERQGAEYVKLHFVSVGWWAVGLFIASCWLAYILGRYRPEIALRPKSESIVYHSAWWQMFHAHPDAYIYIGCHLQDDSYISGYLFSYSTDPDETSDRELALAAPIIYRPVGAQEATRLTDVAAVTVSARQLKFLTVTYTYSHLDVAPLVAQTSDNEQLHPKVAAIVDSAED